MRISIPTERPYDVVIENDFQRLFEETAPLLTSDRLAVFYDETTHALFSAEIQSQLRHLSLTEVVLPVGESAKSLSVYADALQKLADRRFTRKDAVMAVGGGVVGDLAGFVAATYMRGIKCIQCPTTLLADIDASVGGKTAVNLPQGKNLVGAFHQPSLVYVNTSCLHTLPPEQWTNGMGEAVKYAFLSQCLTKEDFYADDRAGLIAKCVQIKAEYVARDEFDAGERAKLNLGHTIGHAVESLSGFSLPHGLCVAKGIAKVIGMSQKYYDLSQERTEKLRNVLSLWHFDLSLPYSEEQLLSKMLSDKKAESDGVNFVLLHDVGDVRVEKLSVGQIETLLQ